MYEKNEYVELLSRILEYDVEFDKSEWNYGELWIELKNGLTLVGIEFDKFYDISIHKYDNSTQTDTELEYQKVEKQLLTEANIVETIDKMRKYWEKH